MALDAEIEALGAVAEARRRRTLAEQVRHILKRRTHRAYRNLLLDANGNLKPDAVTVIADLAKVAQLGRSVPTIATDGELREINGRRTVALHFIERIDLSGAKLRALASKLRESGNE